MCVYGGGIELNTQTETRLLEKAETFFFFFFKAKRKKKPSDLCLRKKGSSEICEGKTSPSQEEGAAIWLGESSELPPK